MNIFRTKGFSTVSLAPQIQHASYAALTNCQRGFVVLITDVMQ